MKRKVFNFSLLAGIGLLAFGVVGLSGCGSSASSQFSPASVSLNKSSLQLAVGEREKLNVTVSKGYGSEVRWFTSNENVVYVSDGYVFGVGEGVATVTAAIGGGYADCLVTVSGEGGVDPVSGKVLTISPTSKTIKLNESFTISYSGKDDEGNPITASFESSDATVATVDANGLVLGVGVGTATISVIGSNELSKNCVVTVKDPSQGGGSDYDIAVDTNLGYSGELTVGSPLIQREFMTNLLREFNELTGSSVKFTVTTFEEDNGTSGYGDAKSMPAVFPYASDQTLTLFQFNALSTVGRTDASWIKEKMGDGAYNAAKLSSLVGYPFSSDNGVVMFYNKSVCQDSEIDTLDKLFALADSKDMEVNYPIGNGFYAAGALMTYANGSSLYSLTPTTTSYTVSSNFNSDAGLKGAKVIRRVANEASLRNATSAPINDVLATIVDASKVQDFKKSLGANYGVAPLPYVEDGVRLGSFLGYKFYGVNNTLSATDKTTAAAVAKFLCSEYVQVKRFDEYNYRPTLTALTDYAKNEAHIAALAAQEAAHATIPLTAISSELWSASATAEGAIKVLGASAADSEYRSILDTLDKACQPSK